ncbi:hypothetical protein L5515_003612 [Caenorhabditis briggsae]|uniref:receptor protein serine/threonine kinase n=1 Tax=Caenorhabditis briggsae TaxID=6238 RepID=A0AAE9EF96_CAEBR|nr:hypothetical protein L3Y34_000753 [Caenorhabditis briggsae]UMM22357.1 hypothetical protein L5515_003612 [Caenorhabditis briggsae]
MVERGTVKLKWRRSLFLFFALLHVIIADDIPSVSSREPVPVEWLNNVISRVDVQQDNQTGKMLASNPRPLMPDLVTTTQKFELPEPLQASVIQKKEVPNFEEEEEEEDGPTLECQHYDEVVCREQGKCNVTTLTCRPSGHLSFIGCVAVFEFPKDLVTNSSEKHWPVEAATVKTLGCMSFQSAEVADCNHPTMCKQSRLTRNTIATCCCTTDNCNTMGDLHHLNPDVLKESEETRNILFPTPRPPPTFLQQLAQQAGYLQLLICLGVIIIVAAVLGLACFLYTGCGKIKKKYKDMEKTNAMENGNRPLVDRESFEMVETPKELPITDFVRIGFGSFGKVFRAKWVCDSGEVKIVAVKKIMEANRRDYEAEKKIFEELHSYGKWYSAIVPFVCAERIGDEYWIVTEFQERLSLYEMLKHNIINPTLCYRLILTMLDGLQFLHDDRPCFFKIPKKPIIHRDIKSRNILVRSDFTACITDFGYARIYEKTGVARSDLLGQVGTTRYMAPEMLAASTGFSTTAFKAMDVYSMSLVMWETINRTKLLPSESPEYQQPYPELQNTKVQDVRTHVITNKMRPTWRPSVLSHELMSLFARVAEDMWDVDADSRITAGCAFNQLWLHTMAARGRSEGYHSGDDESNPLEVSDPLEVYHDLPGKYPHPSADPMDDDNPPPPTVPICTEDGVIHGDAPDVPVQEAFEEYLEYKPEPEQVFSVEKQMLMTRAEFEELKKQEKEAAEAQEFNSRASTPTPAGHF